MSSLVILKAAAGLYILFVAHFGLIAHVLRQRSTQVRCLSLRCLAGAFDGSFEVLVLGLAGVY